MHSPQFDFPYLPRRSAPLRSRSPSRRSKAVLYDDSDSSDLSSDDQPSTVQLQLKLKKPQLRSILKRSQPVNDGSKSGSRYAITVVPYRSTCCGVIVRFEHFDEQVAISSDSIFNDRCPACESWCKLESDPIDTHRPSTNMYSRAKTSPPLSPKSSRRVQFAEHAMVFDISETSQPPPSCLPPHAKALASTSCAVAPPRVSFDAIYSIFNTDFGEAYPDSEHSASLGPPNTSSEMYETFIRVMSVGGLTILLYSVLT